jgi:hypothetical protein
MNHAHARALEGLAPADLDRIDAGCGHVSVPGEPAACGYRYIDLGGDEPPFYLLRLRSGPMIGAVVLQAPIERTSGDDAERGAPAIARASVSIGVNTIPWSRLLDIDLCSGVWADLLGQALEQVAALELLVPADCPICCGA